MKGKKLPDNNYGSTLAKEDEVLRLSETTANKAINIYQDFLNKYTAAEVERILANELTDIHQLSEPNPLGEAIQEISAEIAEIIRDAGHIGIDPIRHFVRDGEFLKLIKEGINGTRKISPLETFTSLLETGQVEIKCENFTVASPIESKSFGDLPPSSSATSSSDPRRHTIASGKDIDKELAQGNKTGTLKDLLAQLKIATDALDASLEDTRGGQDEEDGERTIETIQQEMEGHYEIEKIYEKTITNLRGKILRANKELEKANKVIIKYEDKIKEKDDQIDALNNKITSLRTEKTRLGNRITELEEDLGEEKKNLADANRKVESLNDEVKQLKKDLKNAEAQNEASNELIDRKNDLIRELDELLDKIIDTDEKDVQSINQDKKKLAQQKNFFINGLFLPVIVKNKDNEKVFDKRAAQQINKRLEFLNQIDKTFKIFKKEGDEKGDFDEGELKKLLDLLNENIASHNKIKEINSSMVQTLISKGVEENRISKIAQNSTIEKSLQAVEDNLSVLTTKLNKIKTKIFGLKENDNLPIDWKEQILKIRTDLTTAKTSTETRLNTLAQTKVPGATDAERNAALKTWLGNNGTYLQGATTAEELSQRSEKIVEGIKALEADLTTAKNTEQTNIENAQDLTNTNLKQRVSDADLKTWLNTHPQNAGIAAGIGFIRQQQTTDIDAAQKAAQGVIEAFRDKQDIKDNLDILNSLARLIIAKHSKTTTDPSQITNLQNQLTKEKQEHQTTKSARQKAEQDRDQAQKERDAYQTQLTQQEQKIVQQLNNSFKLGLDKEEKDLNKAITRIEKLIQKPPITLGYETIKEELRQAQQTITKLEKQLTEKTPFGENIKEIIQIDEKLLNENQELKIELNKQAADYQQLAKERNKLVLQQIKDINIESIIQLVPQAKKEAIKESIEKTNNYAELASERNKLISKHINQSLAITPNIVSQVKTQEKDGYSACQLAFQECRTKVLNKSQLGHLNKNKIAAHKHLREAKDMTGFSVGSQLDASLFQEKERIKITGVSKGKGFAGVIKRHGFALGAMSHGGGPVHRSMGSAGGGRGTRQKVPKGKKMPGHLGNEQVTVRNLLIVKIFPEKQLILVKGAVPGQIEISQRGKKEERKLDEYFTNALLPKKEILKPLEILNKQNDYDLKIRIAGGGTTGQLEAIRLGIAKALLAVSPEYRTTLKGFGLLTRDARKVERKKIGLKKARKATQYSKQRTKKNLQAIGYSQLTDIQEKVIPLILEEKDIIAQSQTGTGKTAAFIIPSLEKIEPFAKPQILVLVPTRELALQVSEETKKLSQVSKLRVLAVYGGTSMENQLRSFRSGVDVIIGTPGRIIDHLRRKSFQPANLKFVILDEADEMIDKGFLADIEKIIKMTPASRQTLLFSATITPPVAKFAKLYLKNPVRISGETKNLLENHIEHYYLEVASRKKNSLLVDFLRLHSSELVIVFVNTKRRVEQINEVLSRENLKVDYIHSDLSQARRTRVFNKFRTKQISLLIATDVAARGLHVNDIAYVINYDFPQSSEFYIHRIGRTGRAGASGKAITFISSPKEKKMLFALARQKGYKVEPLNLPDKSQISQILEDKLLKKIINNIEKTEVSQNNKEKVKKLNEKYGAEKVANTLFNLLAKDEMHY
ncbi:3787_t:CDS:10 [Entrophospora sp. SA101]|nr:3787_t:CDS:10 [Entrophospora sp. SA101]